MWVEDGGKLVLDLRGTIDLPKGVCGRCEGTGSAPEQIDEDRYPVMVPCTACRKWCGVCEDYREHVHACEPPAKSRRCVRCKVIRVSGVNEQGVCIACSNPPKLYNPRPSRIPVMEEPF